MALAHPEHCSCSQSAVAATVWEKTLQTMARGAIYELDLGERCLTDQQTRLQDAVSMALEERLVEPHRVAAMLTWAVHEQKTLLGQAVGAEGPITVRWLLNHGVCPCAPACMPSRAGLVAHNARCMSRELRGSSRYTVWTPLVYRVGEPAEDLLRKDPSKSTVSDADDVFLAGLGCPDQGSACGCSAPSVH